MIMSPRSVTALFRGLPLLLVLAASTLSASGAAAAQN